jgi:hypothetical protein
MTAAERSKRAPMAMLYSAVLSSLLMYGCGVVYDASARVHTARMAHDLKTGETNLQVHHEWGEPDLRTTIDAHTELWSYVASPNSNDIAAGLLYTSTKPGDTDKFLDLKFVDNKLVSWNTEKHTMPEKRGSGFSYGLGPSGSAGPISHY